MKGFGVFAALTIAGTLAAAGHGKQPIANSNIPLWTEGNVPLSNGNGPLDNPFLTVFLPADGSANGGSVVIAPGGSNIMLMYGEEGTAIAERYNDWGMTAFVLTYRLSPKYGDDARVLDGKRAIQLVRARSAEWKLDPRKIGFIGFSAGGSLARLIGANGGPGDAKAADPVDRISSRADYLGIVYGPGRATPGESLKDYPPTFLLANSGDAGASNGSAQLFMDLNKAGATVELHLYQKGRHGLGSGFGSGAFSDWMGRLEHFLKQDGFLPGGRP